MRRLCSSTPAYYRAAGCSQYRQSPTKPRGPSSRFGSGPVHRGLMAGHHANRLCSQRTELHTDARAIARTYRVSRTTLRLDWPPTSSAGVCRPTATVDRGPVSEA
jgi:hypothetical protein